jgi:hypothetical protein
MKRLLLVLLMICPFMLFFTYQLWAVDYPLKPWDQWHAISDFGVHRSGINEGYHSGVDLALKTPSTKDGLGKPVYAIADGELFKVDDLKARGWSIVIKHTLAEQKFIIPEHTQEYQYKQEEVPTIFSVYIHIQPIDKLKKIITEPNGINVKKGEIIGYIMEFGGVPHLHFEIRHQDADNSNKGSMLYPIKNWAPNGTTNNNGHYLNMQILVESGARNPLEFLEANVQIASPVGDSKTDLTEVKLEDFFPLTKGSYWIYKGIETNSQGDIDDNPKIIKKTLTSKMEVIDTVSYGDTIVAIMKGYPGYAEDENRNYLIIQKGTKFYELDDKQKMEKVLKRLTNDKKPYIDDLIAEDELFLDLPLTPGKIFGGIRLDDDRKVFYVNRWEVEKEDQVILKNVKGIASTGKVTRYRLYTRGMSIETNIEYVSRVGITRYESVYHVVYEQAVTDLKLIEYRKGQASVPVDNEKSIPTITKVEPAMASAAGGTWITITGIGFKANSAPTVTIGGNPAIGVKVLSETTIKVIIPAGVSGPADIVIQNAYAKAKSLPFKGFIYYEDVIAMTSIPDMATAPPEGIDPPAKIDVVFNQDVDPASVMIKVYDATGTKVVGRVAPDAADPKMFSWTPAAPIKGGDYTATVSGAKGMAAQNVMADMSVPFKVKETR